MCCADQVHLHTVTFIPHLGPALQFLPLRLPTILLFHGPTGLTAASFHHSCGQSPQVSQGISL